MAEVRIARVVCWWARDSFGPRSLLLGKLVGSAGFTVTEDGPPRSFPFTILGAATATLITGHKKRKKRGDLNHISGLGESVTF